MLFVIDIGNSHTVVGLYKKEQLLSHWRLKSDREKTPDEIAIQFHSLFGMADLNVDNITGIIIASVVPSLDQNIQSKDGTTNNYSYGADKDNKKNPKYYF